MYNLDKLDNKIISLIGKTPTYPSEIARNIGVLRTTIQYRLKRMQQLGIAKNVKKGRKTIWSPVFKNQHNKNSIRIYEGKEIIQAYNQLLNLTNLPKQTIILGVQGVQAAKGELSYLPELFTKKAHRIFKRRNIILKGISNNKVLDLFSKLDTPFIKSHIGRTLGVKIFPGDNFLGSGEIMSTEKILLLSNPESKRAIVIKDKGITSIVYDTLKLVLEMLDDEKTFDLNYYLKTKIAPKKQKYQALSA